MPSASSPVAYPLSSSPPAPKRSRPLLKDGKKGPAKSVGGFLIEDDSDGDNDFAQAEPAPKRRMLENPRFPSPPACQNASKADASQLQGDKRGHTTIKSMLGFMIGGTKPVDGPTVHQEAPPAPISEFVDIDDVPSMPSFLSRPIFRSTNVITCSGKSVSVPQRRKSAPVSFEQLVAARSTTKAGRAKKSYYGIDIHRLIDEASKETAKDKPSKSKAPQEVLPSVEAPATKSRPRRTLMWMEKYRARHFMELVGDDRTHRQVLRWLKAWDPLVFPKSGKSKPTVIKRPGVEAEEEKPHRKILLLTGPPGLGKTTLAHVCARQAGYEIMEINASDERSRDVVKGRIRTSAGTESVKNGATVTTKAGQVKSIAHPLCVVVDEVDGVVGGSGGTGEGGFVKALIDLIQLDQKNSSAIGTNSGYSRKTKKGDDFRLMRPLILICNDVYHPSLRPLRHSNLAEIIHVRKPPLDAVIARMKSVFEKEGVSCDGDAVRRLCEATWGVSATESRKGREGAGEGDLRSIMVVGEWAAGKLKASSKDGNARLTRKWVEQNMMSNLSHGGGGARGIGRGGAKEVVQRVFLEGAGFPKSDNLLPPPNISDAHPKTQLGVAELAKKAGMERLREMVDTSGDIDRIVTDTWAQYPNQPFNDDSILSKPDAAYEWLHFHDTCSSRVFSNQDFELTPYLSQPILACHHLFSSPARHYFGGQETKKWGDEEEPEEPLPFSGPRADYEAHEAEKGNRATITALQASLNPTLLRSFRSPGDIATDLLPYLVRMLTPDIKPIIVGGSGDQRGIASVRKESEKAMVKRAVDVMGSLDVIFERGKLDGDFGSRNTQWVYRMEPPLDMLVTFETIPAPASAAAPIRYAARQVLDQEYEKNILVRENAARQARYRAGNPHDDIDFSLPHGKENLSVLEKISGPKKDFFGRVVEEDVHPLQERDGNAVPQKKGKTGKSDNKIWVSYHEGFSNAVRKPITIEELMRGL
ncbi:p-loop containing nucleoside triphosphate hydrolase [Venustampulla echinocandica]|uniref:p-loop containing nucleoside triphosphate hydrolase n=1 Tax=Venustampulla echinocandica TaxID=2656787 RepID=A0A370TJQ9_9HELO|nr:p-loop containing nucleoside triphosphate hydrolase [Venustampulla echinocandica]RDL35753.1 p-loop containing nucleoside triphosphate hydrolase [Venustampulla echinocandica]